jgi:hypothetical protein
MTDTNPFKLAQAPPPTETPVVPKHLGETTSLLSTGNKSKTSIDDYAIDTASGGNGSASPATARKYETDETTKSACGGRRNMWIGLAVGAVVIAAAVIILVEVLVDEEKDKAVTYDSRLPRYFASSPDALCNDGTPADYYVRRSVVPNTDKWVIMLEGGDVCYDVPTCLERSQMYPMALTSNMSTPFRVGRGIMSADPKINPLFWDAHTVSIHYCSSDIWSGNANASTNAMGYEFRGVDILFNVLDDLLTLHGLNNATEVLFGGILTASGVGAMHHIDAVAEVLAVQAPAAKVRGFAESAFILCTEPYNSTVSRSVCDGFIEGSPVWNSEFLPECLAQNYTWQCHLPNITWSMIKTPFFYVHNLFDSSQMSIEGLPVAPMGNPNNLSPDQQDYAEKIAQIFAEQILPIPFTFAPACFAHGLVVFNEDYQDVEIPNLDGSGKFNVVHAMKDWYAGVNRTQYVDSCTGVDCNPTCLKKYKPINP